MAAISAGVLVRASALSVARTRLYGFVDALQELAGAPANTAQINDGLGLVRQQWIFFESALNQKTGGDKRAQLAVATTSERILEEMEGVVGLYEKLPK